MKLERVAEAVCFAGAGLIDIATGLPARDFVDAVLNLRGAAERDPFSEVVKAVLSELPALSEPVAATAREVLAHGRVSASEAMTFEAAEFGKDAFGEATARFVLRRTPDLFVGLSESEHAEVDRVVAAIYRRLLQNQEILESLKHRVWAVVLSLPAQISGLAGRVEELLRAASFDLALDPGTRKIPNAQFPESWLLRPEFEKVPFHPIRDLDVRRIVEWATSESTLSVRLLTAPGGYGKTRLAAMAAAKMRCQEWKAGFIRPEVDRIDDRAAAALVDGRTMLIVDYAEGRTNLLSALLAAAVEGKGPLRILLLARAKAEWWDVLRASNTATARILGSATTFHPLSELPDDIKIRSDIFRQAAIAFGATDAMEVPLLDDGEFGRILYIHMAALAWVGGRRLMRGDELLRDAVGRERRFWSSRLQSLGMNREQRLPLVSQVVAAVTAIGGCASRSELNAIAAAVPLARGLPAIEANAVASLAASLYPTPGELGALRPDLLGEQLLAEEMEHDPTMFARLVAGAT